MIAPEIFKILLDARSFMLQLIKEQEAQITKLGNDSNDNNNVNENTKKSIPEIVLDKIWECIQSCAFDYRNSLLTVFTPIRKFKVFLGNEHITYSQFDPNFWLTSQSNLYVIWRALMTNRGILVIGDSPSQVSCAVFSIISLASPLKYCEPYIAYTRLGDPRFAEIVFNQSRKWKIVGTTNPLLAERCNQFAVVGRLSPIKGDKLKEIDPGLLQQKFLRESGSTRKNYEDNNRNISINSSSSSIWKKLDFLGLKNFSNNMNSLFSLQLNETASTESSLSSFCSSNENFSRSMYCKSFRSATKKMMTLIEFRLNKKIEFDPYFDVLSRELLEEDFYGVFIKSSEPKKKANSNETKIFSENKNILSNLNTNNSNKFKLKKNNINNQINSSKANSNNSLETVNSNNLESNETGNNGIAITLNSGSLNDDDESIENVLCLNFGKNSISQNDYENNNDSKPSENYCNDTDEIDPDLIAKEILNNQSIKIKNISIMKPKHLFISHLPSARASKISSFYLNKYKKKEPRIKFFTTKDALKLQNSLTFKDWRRNITYRSHFRECFLSMMPFDALKERSRDELVQIYNVLVGVISKKYERDFHMATVIKRHIQIVRKLLEIEE